MKILHVWAKDNMPSRGNGYMKNIRQYLAGAEHLLYLTGTDQQPSFEEALVGVDCVVVHGPSPSDKAILDTLNKSGIRTVWVIWGHEITDEYNTAHRLNPKHPERLLRALPYERTKKTFIRNTSVIVAETGDLKLATSRYKTAAKLITYHFAGYADLEIPVFEKKNYDHLRVLVGHNSYAQCRHIDAMEKLKAVDDGTLEVVCPLPYTGEMPAIVSEVTQAGKALFGDRFTPIYDRLPYAEYCNMLFDVDLVLFNHNRQMAQGNIEKLLYYGKKIYFAPENTDYKMYIDMGASVYLMEDLTGETALTLLSPDEVRRNHELIEKTLDPTDFINTWTNVFEEI